MDSNLILYLLLNIGLLLLVATILTELRPLRLLLKQQSRSLSNQASLGLIFGLMSICCTYTGLNFLGAIVNTRVISTVAAGLVGGPLAGIMAGALSGLHRYLISPDGFTSLSCGIGTFCFGLIGAAAHTPFSRVRRRNLTLVLLAVLAELIQCIFILLLAKPFSDAVALEKAILLPKMVVNSVGLVIFMNLLERLNRVVTIELAEQHSLALVIAQKCMPFLREGMGNRSALQKSADIVRSMLPEFQVVITDDRQVLAASGIDLSSVDPLPAPAQQTMETLKLQITPGYTTAQSAPRLVEWAAIAAPLLREDCAVGSLMLVVPMGPNRILEADAQTTDSLAQFFSTMLELGELENQINLRQQAEFRALQSQINPHFLFNALNTISALCLANPNKARETILVLANYFRQTLSINEPFVTLAQEMSNVDNYLYLTEARFENALHITRELPDDLHRLRLPPLILQPIVENAVRHGGVAVDDRRVSIQIRQDDTRAYIRISDQGHGFPAEMLERLQDPNDSGYSGLFNVRKRLRSIYGSQCQFEIQSSSFGSTVSFSIPLVPPESPYPSEQKE